MKILLIHQQFLGPNDPGGSRFNEFVRYWSHQGHELTVLAGMVNYTTGHKEQAYKGKFVVKEEPLTRVTVYRSFIYAGHSPKFLGRVWRFCSFAFSSLIVGLFMTGKQDVVLATSPPLFLGITGRLIAFFKRIPSVFEVRDLWPESAIETGMIPIRFLIKCSYWLEKYVYSRAKLINCVTPAIRDVLISKGVPEEKLVCVPNGADLDFIKPGPKKNWVRETYGWGDKFVLLYTGAHGVANHLWQLLEAAKLLEDHEDIHIVLIGSGLQKAELVERAKSMKLSNLQFIDPQPRRKMADFTNAADVCTAVLMDQEVFKTVYPNKIFDYMACAKPIIIGIDGAARKLVEIAKAGEYAPPEDAHAIRDLVLKFYNDLDLANQYGQNGYDYVREHFAREHLANEYIEILQEIGQSKVERNA